MNNNHKTVILVLGMHRSGTSALTGMLNCFGADVPLDANTRINPDNPKGHWEHNQIVRFNDQVLRHFGLTWTTWGTIDVGELPENLIRRIRSFVAELVDQSRSPVVAFKDPRFCLLFPLWEEVFAPLGYRTRFVYSLREPDAVARSIANRNRLSYERGLLLWLGYNLTILRLLADRGCYQAQFPDWMHQSEAVYHDSAEQLGIEWPRSWDQVRSKVNEFLDVDLVHNPVRFTGTPGFLLETCQRLHSLVTSSGDTRCELRGFVEDHGPWLEVCGRAVVEERQLWRSRVTDIYNLMHRNL